MKNIICPILILLACLIGPGAQAQDRINQYRTYGVGVPNFIMPANASVYYGQLFNVSSTGRWNLGFGSSVDSNGTSVMSWDKDSAVVFSGAITAAAGITAPVTGAITGDVTGNLTGNVTGNVTGDLTGSLTITKSVMSKTRSGTATGGVYGLHITSAITPTTIWHTVISSGGDIQLTSTPNISTNTVLGGATEITDGTLLIITSTASAGSVIFVDEGTLTNSQLQLGSTTRTVGLGDVLELFYDADTNYWYEISYTDN